MAKLASSGSRIQGRLWGGCRSRPGAEMVFSVEASRWCRCCSAGLPAVFLPSVDASLVAEHWGVWTLGTRPRGNGWGGRVALIGVRARRDEGWSLRPCGTLLGSRVWALSTAILAVHPRVSDLVTCSVLFSSFPLLFFFG